MPRVVLDSVSCLTSTWFSRNVWVTYTYSYMSSLVELWVSFATQSLTLSSPGKKKVYTITNSMKIFASPREWSIKNYIFFIICAEWQQWVSSYYASFLPHIQGGISEYPTPTVVLTTLDWAYGPHSSSVLQACFIIRILCFISAFPHIFFKKCF